jgi:hypothetical protein
MVPPHYQLGCTVVVRPPRVGVVPGSRVGSKEADGVEALEGAYELEGQGLDEEVAKGGGQGCEQGCGIRHGRQGHG